MIDRSHADRPVVILDRDGVINLDSDHYIKRPEEWQPLPGSLEAMARLSQEGWRIFVATNQSGLARGLFDLPMLHAIHAKMEKMLSDHGGQIEAIFFCPHGPDQGCLCRKPAPGLIEEIARRAGCSPQGLPLVGDSHRDLAASAATGGLPLLVRTGKGERTLADHDNGSKPLPVGTEIFPSLKEAADRLLKMH